MANWNGSYFGTGTGGSSNYNMYPSGQGNWSYYNPFTRAGHPDSAQPMHAIFPHAASFYGSAIPHPPETGILKLASSYAVEGPSLNYFQSQEDKLATIAATSSLTATAGVFVPRSSIPQPFAQNGAISDGQDKQVSFFSDVPTSSTSYSRERGQSNKRSVNNDVKYFPSNRSNSAYNQNYNGTRKGSWNGVQQYANNRPNSMDDSQIQAPLYVTPCNQESGAAVSLQNDIDGTNSEKLHKKNQFSNIRGRDLYSHAKPESNYQSKSDTGVRVFTNSRFSASGYDPGSFNRNHMQQQEYFNKNHKWRNHDSFYQHGHTSQGSNNQTSSKNEMSSSEESYSGVYFSGKSYLGKLNNFGNGISRHNDGGCNRTSPHKKTFHTNGNGGSKDDDVNQRERLADQLTRATLECLVCCERVRQHDPIWSCTNCYHVLHLKCIKKWAKSSKAESGWRCPACQNVSAKIPQEYRCFCGKCRDPEWNRQDTAHTCGEVCGKSRTDKKPDCVHRCVLLCHPGPCPSCGLQVTRSCGCGKSTQVVICGSDQPLLCGAVCDKVLNCNQHRCTKNCHVGECGLCQEIVKQACFCGKETREVQCTAESVSVSRFSCGKICDRVLACGHHKCTLVCHEGPCVECMLTPERVTHCPCGKMELTTDHVRSSCLDTVPTCDNICEKKLSCGQPGNPHHCQAKCHCGPCPPCPLSTMVKCRCGHIDREIKCQDLTTKADDARCEKRCTKKRSCGKHKCNQMCCIDIDHVCPLPCNHMLSCGRHRCEDLCHRGHCRPCWRTSFEELYCECGANVIYPPVPCGTRRPECDQPCSRQHDCDHPALHNCHSDATCPPCTVLMQRYCYGRHELRKSVPCHQTEISCGMPCNTPLPCGRHRCILPCHKGPCLREGRSCTQPCTIPRAMCGHPCAALCHDGPCPDTPCKEMVKVTCECGHRSMSRTCSDNAKEYQRIATALLASKMADMQMGHSVDIGDLGGSQNARTMSLKTLDCNEECKVIERNRRLAIGLQIRNPDLSAKLTPRYSEFMRQWAKKDPHFCNMVHEKLTELVQLAKQSKQKSRSYSFDSMNRDKRNFVHDYCEHFGCESQAYDQEPKRNVVATASRDKAWLPSMSLLEVIQRESGQRKVPKPVINTVRSPIIRPAEAVSLKAQTLVAKNINQNPPKEEQEEIDYFELTS